MQKSFRLIVLVRKNVCMFQVFSQKRQINYDSFDRIYPNAYLDIGCFLFTLQSVKIILSILNWETHIVAAILHDLLPNLMAVYVES